MFWSVVCFIQILLKLTDLVGAAVGESSANWKI